jgi:DNA-binding NarL/FixJ family response regulator
MSGSRKIRVIIAHDQPLIAAGLTKVLIDSGDFEPVRAEGPPQGTAGASEVDVVVADYELGLNMAAAIGSTVPIVLVTKEDGESQIRRAAERGVSGYLTLGCRAEDLVASVRAVAAGGKAWAPSVANRIVASLAKQALTTRELEVLVLVGRGLSNKAVGRHLSLSEGTIKTHVKSILSKLQAISRTEATAVAHERGILGRDSLTAVRIDRPGAVSFN